MQKYEINVCIFFLYINLFLSTGKSLYVDRLFEKFQQKSPGVKYIRIRLIEPCIDIDSLVKNLSEKLAPLREQDPVLLHIDTAGVSLQAFISSDNIALFSVVLESRLLLFCYLSGSFGSRGAPVPSLNPRLFE